MRARFYSKLLQNFREISVFSGFAQGKEISRLKLWILSVFLVLPKDHRVVTEKVWQFQGNFD